MSVETDLDCNTQRNGRVILYLGVDWWGSDPRALAMAFRRAGNYLIEVQYEDYFPLGWASLPLRVIRRLVKAWCAKDFNAVIERHLENGALDFVVVFKGMLLSPETLKAFRAKSVPIYCFYPDVSFGAHGAGIAECLPYYDCLFTTKEFHMRDEKVRAQLRDIRLVRHGFDPEVHRPIRLSGPMKKQYGCDVSFIGTWSSKKEGLIAALIDSLPECSIRIWGPGWSRARTAVRQCWMGRGAYGDELAIIFQCSEINLGLLSEAATDTSSGDQTTARTWQVPATGAFFLHEDTAELRRSFEAGEEVVTFVDAEDLVRKVERYLRDPSERGRVAAAGLRRATTASYTYDSAARMILDYHTERENRVDARGSQQHDGDSIGVRG